MLKTFMALLFAGTALGAADLVELTMDDGRTLIGEYDEAAGVLRSSSHGIKVVTSIDPGAVVRVQAYIQTHEDYLRERTGGARDPSLADARRLLAVADQRIERITADIAALDDGIRELSGVQAGADTGLAESRAHLEMTQRRAEWINNVNRVDIVGNGSDDATYYRWNEQMRAYERYKRHDSHSIRTVRVERDQLSRELRERQIDARNVQTRLAHLRNKRMELQAELLEAKNQRRQALAQLFQAGAGGISQEVPDDQRLAAPAIAAPDVGMVHRFPDLEARGISLRNTQAKWLHLNEATREWRLGFMAQAVNLEDFPRYCQLIISLLDAEGYQLRELQHAFQVEANNGNIVRASFQVPAEIAGRVVDIDISLH